MNAGMRRMLEGKDHRNLDTVVRLVPAFVDRVLKMERTASTTEANTKYTDFSNILCGPEERMVWSVIAVGKLEEEFKAFKKKLVEHFRLHFQLYPYKLKIPSVGSYCRRPGAI